MTASAPQSIVFSIWGPITRADLPGLCERVCALLSRPRHDRITGFVDEVTDATVTRGPSAGLGEDVRLRGPGVIGAGLELDGERIQLSAFTSDGSADRAFGRIARPSRRR